MSDPVWLPEVLRAEGVTVAEYPGWRERGHGDFGKIWGVVCHHTGDDPPYDAGPSGIANHPTLGLCSQIHLGRNGIATIVGAGIAWHAGNGSWPGIARDNANAVTIGIEAENNGTEGWTPVQRDAYVRIVAAILRKIGEPSSHAIGHREWYHGRPIDTADARRAGGKWDPGALDMPVFRNDVQRRIDNRPATGEDDDMTDDDRKLLQAVHRELTQRYPSRSKYRTDDKPFDTLAGIVLNIDGRVHEESVEREARNGAPWAQALVRREAAKGDLGAAGVLAEFETATKS